MDSITAEKLNKYFASISTDQNYSEPTVAQYNRECNDFVPFEIDHVEKFLSRLKHTAAGEDKIPFWFLKQFSAKLSTPLAYLFNRFINEKACPISWKNATITPISKITNPTEEANFRPISVTPILCRIFEKNLVKFNILPNLSHHTNSNQYAFRPSCSTTAANTAITHSITEMFENGAKFVRCITVDFSKAFDSVPHSILIEKYKSTKIPSLIINWLIDYLSYRTHCTVFNNKISSLAKINASVIQGSGIGPISFCVFVSDIKTISKCNKFEKYADDATLLVPSNSDVDIMQEFGNIINWSQQNCLKINFSKTKEIIFYHRSKPSPEISLVPGVERVKNVTILGILYQEKFSFSQHLNKTLVTANQRLYLVNSLRKAGLCPESTNVIFHSLVLSKLTYCVPSWHTYISAIDVSKINKFKKSLLNGTVLIHVLIGVQLLTILMKNFSDLSKPTQLIVLLAYFPYQNPLVITLDPKTP